MPTDTCTDCGADEVRVHLGGVPLCDRCSDRRVARLMGLPELGDPPAPFVVADPDGRQHRLQPRPWRAPTGIVVGLEETGVPAGDGFQFSILGSHDADVNDLVSRLRTHAQAEIGRKYLKPNHDRAGWVLAEDEVAGRLVWGEDRDTGGPYDVVVDGRTVSWEELGRALEPFEGWRFRLVIEDRSLDVRPDADVVPLVPRTTSAPSHAPATVPPPAATIAHVLDEFLVAQKERLAERTFANYWSVIDLLRHCLNNYGHQHLGEDDRVRFESAFDAGDEEAFVHLFGPDKIADVMGEFLDYFMVRKVMAGEELLRAAGTVTKRLAKWMAANGYLDAESADEAVEQATIAARDLPRAERLSRLLFEQVQRSTTTRRGAAEAETIEDRFTIERVEPGALWLDGDIGPIEVDTSASDLARPGWTVYLVLSHSDGRWQILEAGNAYP